jgi:hypothetical protein
MSTTSLWPRSEGVTSRTAIKNGHYRTKGSTRPDTDPLSKEIEDVNDDDAFTTKGVDDESATVIPFDEEL